jgi:hypothetical protein
MSSSPRTIQSRRRLVRNGVLVTVADAGQILETLLTRMGCRCICVEDGPQALAATMGSIRE